MTDSRDDRRDLRSDGHEEHEERTEGGDPVCWLDRVCNECGAMREDMGAARCARCGTPFHGAGADRGDAQQPPAR
ncbi:hypothetical protein NMG29_13500 [Streptomyces cocklensis]|jgi:hypothetical protein|uniref:Uncharacterized protein n=1 Tax=Actinacidiphila cocklensis TaxID=887465 RepID=A0A9W4GUG8_9ACTN|nr:hypothetical protein [Actinacidiphila cocklensis]MDD1059214.1 hypothetical protein [Actinacidiphila cocklensis]CAG6396850.1 conserved hypothetical protein [Actinacidiphila cocklensis]